MSTTNFGKVVRHQPRYWKNFAHLFGNPRNSQNQNLKLSRPSDLKIWASKLYSLEASAADPGCLSRIPDPDFYPSRIPDPKTATKERNEKKFVVITLYVATNAQNCKLF
jgi:hypothetical protein